MQKAIDEVPPLSARDVITVVVGLAAVAAVTIVLRVATPLADGYAALLAVVAVIALGIWWSRRRRADGDDT